MSAFLVFLAMVILIGLLGYTALEGSSLVKGKVHWETYKELLDDGSMEIGVQKMRKKPFRAAVRVRRKLLYTLPLTFTGDYMRLVANALRDATDTAEKWNDK